jgi:hypothetical protein
MPKLGDRQPYSGPDSPLLLLGREPGPDGTYGRPAPDAPLPRDPTNPALWLPGQGQANACGTTNLAYVLRYLLGPSAPDRQQIDHRVRRANIFTAPGLIVAYARRLGLAAERYGGVELDEMLALVDRGIPVMALTDTTPLDLTDTASLHWVCLVGHDGDRLAVYNPHGFQEEIDRASFESHWREARLFGLPAWSRLAIAVAPPGIDLPSPGRVRFSAVGATWAAGGVAGIINGAVSLSQQAFREGPSLSSLAVIPGLLGLTVPTAQAVAGTAVLLGAAAAARLRHRG